MASVHSGEEILPKASIPMSRVHQRYRQTDRQTDDRQQTDRQTELRQQRPERNVVTFG